MWILWTLKKKGSDSWNITIPDMVGFRRPWRVRSSDDIARRLSFQENKSVEMVREEGFEPSTFRYLPETSVLSLASHLNEV